MAGANVTLHTRVRWDTGYSADSVEWCPVPPYTEYVVCGTYQLHKEELENQPAKRLGRIYLFKVTPETRELSPTHSVETAGVLDLKWCCHLIGGRAALAAVTSEGLLQVYRLVEERLELWVQQSIGKGENLLALSVDWSSNKHGGEHMLVVSDSGGGVSVLRLTNCGGGDGGGDGGDGGVGGGLEESGVWQAHGFEAWVAAFDYWTPNLFYTGGDDCLFRSYDVREPKAVTTSRAHGAGVTAIRSHVLVEHQLVTGSYDEFVRLWDTRQLKNCITETNVGGGVWRLKWHPSKRNLILAACMYGGFRVLSFENELRVLSEYSEHESIAYGADWDSRGDTVGTCSFYDCRFHISDVVYE